MTSSKNKQITSPATTNSDPRLALLVDWIATLSEFPLLTTTMRPASTDASFRRYFRINDALGKSYILMDAPPPQEDVRPFIHIAQLFGDTGVTVPHILASHPEHGFLLLSDLGTVMYSHLLNQDTAQKLYMDAIDSLVQIQLHSQPEVLPEYDRAMQLKELMLFPEWYIGKHLGATLTPTQQASLDKVFEQILANTMAQPQVYVHRDYHSRNLMVMKEGNPGVLDFQGALYGPITYDIVSLLRDAYIEWDEEQVLDWAIRYWERARHAGLPISTDIDSFYRDFEFMGLQRHLKILGIFSRLAYRDGKDNYLADLPLVLSYVRKTAQRYNTLIPLLRILDELADTAPQVGYTF
ncbi:aminoglycoside phosphotransferase family protein [Solimicrobium silvestre]|uniref:Putative phosphotransferase related to Ser/Thr protein kinase n=1 Tax=Solimicrobium silvestre TaxID=2099400 RepID=A0A2S9H189_9BURK|nr:phosphotransferase [Solimicrobium silvestre]PRC93755.1 putative phosphotransferase related to Ser/Thr protein kinase [Solimicrobium silvestre]